MTYTYKITKVADDGKETPLKPRGIEGVRTFIRQRFDAFENIRLRDELREKGTATTPSCGTFHYIIRKCAE